MFSIRVIIHLVSQLQTFSTRKCTSIDDVVHNSSQISKMGKKKVAGVSHTNAKKVAEKIVKHDELAALNDRLLAGWSSDPGLLGMSVLPPEIKKTQKRDKNKHLFLCFLSLLWWQNRHAHNRK